MRTLKITLEYDGTDYVGWQRQAAGLSIQGLLEAALARFEGVPVTVHGAGRTDAGVHALGQVATAAITTSLDCATLARALNALLPPDVRVIALSEAAPDFHARFSATGKIYEYRIVNAPLISAFLHRYAWHILPALDVEAMREAGRHLVGRHDFRSFQAAGSPVGSAERAIRRLEWQDGSGFERPLVLRVEGDGFLRHMVRTIAGTLVEVGLGRRTPGEVAAILAARDRARAGPTAPAHGLFLVRVLY